MVCNRQVVVYGLWHSYEGDGFAADPGVSGELVNRVHGIISADIETGAYVHGCEFFQ